MITLRVPYNLVERQQSYGPFTILHIIASNSKHITLTLLLIYNQKPNPFLRIDVNPPPLDPDGAVVLLASAEPFLIGFDGAPPLTCVGPLSD